MLCFFCKTSNIAKCDTFNIYNYIWSLGFTNLINIHTGFGNAEFLMLAFSWIGFCSLQKPNVRLCFKKLPRKKEQRRRHRRRRRRHRQSCEDPEALTVSTSLYIHIYICIGTVLHASLYPLLVYCSAKCKPSRFALSRCLAPLAFIALWFTWTQ